MTIYYSAYIFVGVGMFAALMLLKEDGHFPSHSWAIHAFYSAVASVIWPVALMVKLWKIILSW